MTLWTALSSKPNRCSVRALACDSGFELIHTPPYADAAVIAEHIVSSQAVGIVSRMGRIDAAVMDAAPNLKVISKHGVGVDNIDLAAAAERAFPTD